MNLQAVNYGSAEWVNLGEDMVHGTDLINIVMKLQMSYNGEL
jgi:hypothetical protein